jgi:hypothetical protein
MKKKDKIISGSTITRILVKELVDQDYIDNIDKEYEGMGYERVDYLEVPSAFPTDGNGMATILRITYDKIKDESNSN